MCALVKRSPSSHKVFARPQRVRLDTRKHHGPKGGVRSAVSNMESGDESSFSDSEDAFTGTLLYGGALAPASAQDNAGADASRKRATRPSADEGGASHAASMCV